VEAGDSFSLCRSRKSLTSNRAEDKRCSFVAAHLPEALSTNCAKCTDAQKSIVKKASKYLIANNARDWNDITKKYDPERKFHDSFHRFLNEE
jgi:hypothetical protein